ncbi:uncharacterized protein TNIN_331261 [Trichonephila inaurata madagascariensis]|uniref:Uncharacterized protein n=1 Tax=Trichonephila inaurata madagascariensis TaxID=2747483 RepID=A0A8X6K418_9ARAC|nr:uncharacterized protein TNIN_331261 [Trichonephila inaurata madagascariensis]
MPRSLIKWESLEILTHTNGRRRGLHTANMLQGIFLFSCLLGAAFAGNSANQYVDNVLHTTLSQELQSLDLNPAPLSDFTFGVRGIDGKVEFTFGNVTGLDHVRRKGDCSGPKNFTGEITINCTLSIYPVITSYRVALRNGSNVHFLRIQGNLPETQVHIEIAGRPQNYVGSVKNYRVGRLAVVTPTFSKHPPALNKYLRVLKDAYRAHVSTQLLNIFERRYVYAFGQAFAHKPMPRQ